MFRSNSLIIILVLVLLNLFTFKLWRHDHDLYTKEKVSHAADIKTFKDAQALANKKAEDTKKRIEHEAEQNAKDADKAYTDLLSKYRANLVRYSTHQSGGSRSDSGQSPSPESGNGPSESPDVLTITKDDAETCAVNTARLQAVHDWAIKQEEVDANP